ncbi:13722_t:CDS:2, partial [Gigaspora margarita]
SSPNIYKQDITTNFSPPCFDTYELDDANALLPNFSYEHNIANVSSFYSNAYKHYDNANISLPGLYKYDSVMSTYINIQDTLTESDDETVNLTNVEVVSVRDLLQVQHKDQQPKRYKF